MFICCTESIDLKKSLLQHQIIKIYRHETNLPINDWNSIDTIRTITGKQMA